MDRQTVSYYLESKLGPFKYTSQGLKCCCFSPKCDPSQSKFNLEICLDKNRVSKGKSSYLRYKCWACGIHGHIRHLLREFALNDSWRAIKELQTTQEKFIDIPQERTIVELPSTIPYYLSEEASEYLIKERNIHEVVLQEHKVLYCYSEQEELYNKIIFPFYEEGQLIGYSTHDFRTKKYRNHRNLNFVPYKELINPNYPVILTEGVYDSFSVPNAIPMLGTTASEAILRFAKDKKIILCMDREVDIDDKKAIADKLYLYGAKIVVIFDMKEYKDLNEYRVKDKKELKEELKNIFELLNSVN